MDRPKILITGCDGLIGSQLVKSLHNSYQLIGLDNNETPPELHGLIDVYICDLTDDDSVAGAMGQIFDKHGPELASVIHLAAYYDFSGEPSDMYNKLTVQGTRRLLKQLQRFEAQQFIFASTLLVMDSAPAGSPLTENSPINAEWDYPKSKVTTENVIRNERGEIPAVILRVAGVYDENCHSVPIAQQIARIYEKQLESYLFPGNAEHGQSFVHLQDLVDCIQLTIACRKTLHASEVFLIGEEDVMSYEELQDHIGNHLHSDEWTTIRIPKFVAKTGAWVKCQLASGDSEAPFIKPWMIDLADQNYPIDNSKAREQLGWAPQHTLRQTLPAMIRSLQSNPRHWYEINGLQPPAELCHI